MRRYRVKKVEDLIKKEIANLLLKKVSDPRLSDVTITDVELSKDLGRAVVYYDTVSEVDEIQKGFEKASPFIRRELSKSLYLKHIPKVEFRYRRLNLNVFLDNVFLDGD